MLTLQVFYFPPFFPSKEEAPPLAPSPIQFQKIPRKTNQAWKSDEGEGGNAEALRGVGGIVGVITESERMILVRATTRSARGTSAILEIGASLVQ